MDKKQSKELKYSPVITTHFEFLGPHGVIATILAVPTIVFLLFPLCSKHGCPPPIDQWNSAIVFNSSLIDPVAFKVILYWFGLHLFLYSFLPGRSVLGAPTPNGLRLTYNINGLNSFFLIIGTLFVSILYSGLTPLLWIADNQFQLSIAASIISSLLALSLYIASFRSPTIVLAEGGNSGYHHYDFWMGRELNPRLFNSIDLKFLCELRPGLIGWLILNLSSAAKQYSELGYVTNSMVIVLVGQGYYVFDALWNEQAILTTMDITTDGFGFMLVFGDLVWVPFTYSLQARYLAMFPLDLSFSYLLFIVFTNLLGLWIFRSSNSEKNAFRTNPNQQSVSHLKFMTTQSGSKLLITGWWGAARKINYTGDWIMSFAWCLPCGFSSPIPYFYTIYFAILLVHRAYRDDAICLKKYGKDWITYKSRVPYMFIPGVI
ncbi:ergosterol biosynthesis ERG4/ERG24 [Globomyces pollinis-pini]|nr:ergosterol biosynthesis ERG4/ERG24 [Globomyces pollinis-pini]